MNFGKIDKFVLIGGGTLINYFASQPKIQGLNCIILCQLGMLMKK